MPTTSLSTAYNYRLWIVYLNKRYNIFYPFRHLLCFKMTVVRCIGRTLFLKEVYLSFYLKKVTFLRKNVFFLACNTHFTSIFTLIAHYFNPRLQAMYWNVSIFNVLKRVELYHICFSKWEHKEKKRNIENLTQIEYIAVQYSDTNSQLFYNFINLLLIYTHLNGN